MHIGLKNSDDRRVESLMNSTKVELFLPEFSYDHIAELEMIKRLKNKFLKLGIGSNGDREMIDLSSLSIWS